MPFNVVKNKIFDNILQKSFALQGGAGFTVPPLEDADGTVLADAVTFTHILSGIETGPTSLWTVNNEGDETYILDRLTTACQFRVTYNGYTKTVPYTKMAHEQVDEED